MILSEIGTERAVVGTIIKLGKDALIEVEDIVSVGDFTEPINRDIFRCIKALSDDGSEEFDTDTIHIKAESLGITSLSKYENVEYLELCKETGCSINNIRNHALQVKKLSFARDLYQRHKAAAEYIKEHGQKDPLTTILANSEKEIVDFANGVNDGSFLIEKLSNGMRDRVNFLLENDPVDITGIPTGFPIHDRAIGGGIRRHSVHIVGARSKTGKSYYAMNVAHNVASSNIPTLYLDSEMTESEHQSRLMCIHAGCPIDDFETGKFRDSSDLRQRVCDALPVVEGLPIYYKSIAGMGRQEVILMIRRWINKVVGFNASGKANDCLIIYDYYKITDPSSVSGHIPEFLALGLMLIEFNDFCIKYDVPILGFVQLNREGIDTENTAVVAGSDRILWICSSLSIIKNKDSTDASLGCGSQHGNKKMLVLDTRYGPGLDDGDYINLRASIRPGTPPSEATGRFLEGNTLSQVRLASYDT